MICRVELIIKLLGLQRAADTVVGNAMLRGVSGGERKRVTSAGGFILKAM
jgi:ABC-type multidrug transport system ATPase subunit